MGYKRETAEKIVAMGGSCDGIECSNEDGKKCPCMSKKIGCKARGDKQALQIATDWLNSHPKKAKESAPIVFERGKFYKGSSGVIVVCTNDCGADGDCFSGIAITEYPCLYLKDSDNFTKSTFYPIELVEK